MGDRIPMGVMIVDERIVKCVIREGGVHFLMGVERYRLCGAFGKVAQRACSEVDFWLGYVGGRMSGAKSFTTYVRTGLSI